MDPTGTMPWLTTGGGGGSNINTTFGNIGNILGGAGSLYGSYLGAQNQNNLSGAANTGFGMATGAYNPTMFNMNGVGGSGFSLSSPNGGPGSISTSLGAFDPLYGGYAGQAGQYGNLSMGLANTAGSGATGAYQTALSSMLPQLQNMQQNLLTANNNALFQRGQLGSGSFGQYGATGSPINLTTSSLAQGFGQQDLQAIMAAQNQGLNFFNSNLQGANTLGGLGFGATNTGLGMIGAQNALAQNPLAYSQLYGGQQIGATNAMANVIKGSNYQGNAFSSGTGGLLQSLLGGSATGNSGGIGGLINTGRQLYNGYNQLSNLFGGGIGNAGAIGGGAMGDANWANSVFAGGGGGGFIPGGIGGTDYIGGGLGNLGDMTGGLGQFAGGGGSDFLSGLGFNSAGGGAAGIAAPADALGLGTAADTTGMAALNEAGMPAADAAFGSGAGASSGLAAAAPALAGLAGLGAFMGVMGNQPGTGLSGQYWNNLNSTLAAGPGSGQNFGPNGPNAAGIKQYTDYEGAMAALASAVRGQGQGAMGNNVIPNSEWQQLAQYGITPASVTSYNDAWSNAAANEPTLEAENAQYGIPNTSKPSSQKK